MYNRQEIYELPLNPILQDQLDFPIVQIVQELREGSTKKVALKTEDGYFVTARDGGGGLIFADAISVGENETFLLIPQGLNREDVAIQTANGEYLSALDGGGKRIVTSPTIGPNEKFALIPINPDKANFITYAGYFVFALTGGSKLLTAYAIASDPPRARFIIIPQD